jgi:hypothetical protein
MPHMARLPLYGYNDGEVSFVRHKQLFSPQGRKVLPQTIEFSADEDDFELPNTPRRRAHKICSPFVILYSVLSMLFEKTLLVFKAGWSLISTLKPVHWNKKVQEATTAFKDTDLSTRSQGTVAFGENIFSCIKLFST